MLNVALACLKRLLSNGEFSATKTTDEIRTDYHRKASPEAVFAEDCLEVDPNLKVEKAKVYAAYTAYCRANKLPMKSEGSFWKLLPRYVNYQTDRPKINGKRGRVVAGIRLKDAEEKEKPDEKKAQKKLERAIGTREKIETIIGLIGAHVGRKADLDYLKNLAGERGIPKDEFGPLISSMIREGLIVPTVDEKGVRLP